MKSSRILLVFVALLNGLMCATVVEETLWDVCESKCVRESLNRRPVCHSIFNFRYYLRSINALPSNKTCSSKVKKNPKATNKTFEQLKQLKDTPKEANAILKEIIQPVNATLNQTNPQAASEKIQQQNTPKQANGQKPVDLNDTKPQVVQKPVIVKCNTRFQTDCYDQYKMGFMKNLVLPIKPKTKPDCNSVKVFCEMTTGGYTVIMRRNTGDLDFYRNWTEYKNGFGDPTKEYWIGNDMLHYLTTDSNNSLRIEFEDWNGVKKFASYDKFIVNSESDSYSLFVSGYSGNAGDSLSAHSGKKFSTFDVDNDEAPIEFWNGNCAKRFHGAWWYSACYRSNLNGLYYKDTKGLVKKGSNDGMSWNAWHGNKYSLKSVLMKIRRNFNTK